jgi:DNA repair protein radA
VPRGSFMNGKKAPAGVVECRTVEEAIGAMFR